MSKKEDKALEDGEGPRGLSRREFAIGAVVTLGASWAEASALPPLTPEAQAMRIEKSEEVKSVLDERHILDDDVRRVIDNAEKTDDKLYQPGTDRLLSQLKVNEVHYYVEYSPCTGGFRIHTAYSHRLSFAGGE